MKILVIDDSRFQRSQMTRMLGELGHVVLEATNGQEGYVKLLQDAPEVVLCDLLMPVMDGFAFLAAVQKHGLATPVIVASADVQNSTREQCFQLGAHGFLNKPCTKLGLEEVLKALPAMEERP